MITFLNRKTQKIETVTQEEWDNMHGRIPLPDYVKKRLQEYPSIDNQLDMIYWDRVNSTNLWVEKITEIKNKYPKPLSK